MKRLLSLSLLSLLFGFTPQDSSDFDWQDDLPAARAQAQKDGRPMLVVFR